MSAFDTRCVRFLYFLDVPEGNLYIASGEKIGVYSSEGEKLTEIEIPNKTATNLCFGRGPWSKTLFITTFKKLYTLEIKKEGFHIQFKK